MGVNSKGNAHCSLLLGKIPTKAKSSVSDPKDCKLLYIFVCIIYIKGMHTDTTYFDFRITQINSTEARSARMDLKSYFF